MRHPEMFLRYFGDCSFDLGVVTKCRDAIANQALMRVANAFVSHLDDVYGLVQLPVVTASAVPVAVGSMVDKVVSVICEASKLNRPDVSGLWDEYVDDATRVEMSISIIDTWLRIDKYRATAESLLRSAAVSTWTAFECVAHDAWEAALNEDPRLATRSCVASDKQGSDARVIPLGLIARHDFDLRGKMGTLLKDKFDFTGVDGIQRAFDAAFGKGALQSDLIGDLKDLEALRHVLVHNGGFVDDRYFRRTRGSANAGERVQITGEKVTKMAGAVASAGCALLSVADHALQGQTENRT